MNNLILRDALTLQLKPLSFTFHTIKKTTGNKGQVSSINQLVYLYLQICNVYISLVSKNRQADSALTYVEVFHMTHFVLDYGLSYIGGSPH